MHPQEAFLYSSSKPPWVVLLINLHCVSFQNLDSAFCVPTPPVEQFCKQFYIWQIIIGKSHSPAQSFSPQFLFEWMWKNKCINAFLAEGMNKVLTQNRWNFDWLNELIHELEFALMTDWQTPRQCLGFFWCAANPSWILLMRRIAWDSGRSRPSFATLCCDSRYSPSSTAPGGMTNSKNKCKFSVGFTPTTLGRWEQLEHHMGHAGFPSTNCRVCVCVRRPSWTALTQLAGSDGPQGGLPLPRGINIFYFIFLFIFF